MANLLKKYSNIGENKNNDETHHYRFKIFNPTDDEIKKIKNAGINITIEGHSILYFDYESDYEAACGVIGRR